MSDPGGNKRWRFQFSLRLLLIAVAGSAAVFWLIRRLNVSHIPTVTLAQAINQFNLNARDNSVGALEPPLTEDEVLAPIQSQSSTTLARYPDVKPIFEEILRTKQIPADTRIYFIDGWQRAKNGPDQTVWWINLDVVTNRESKCGFALRVRENDAPAILKKSAEPQGE